MLPFRRTTDGTEGGLSQLEREFLVNKQKKKFGQLLNLLREAS